MASEPTIGILALQGDYAAHARMLAACGVASREVRKPQELAGLRGLILPGGESSALLRLMEPHAFQEALRAFAEAGGALFGTCAGLILLARRVSRPQQRSLGLMDIEVARNAYGRQLDSFESDAQWVDAELAGPEERPLPLVFIRAPRITAAGPGVQVLARCREDAVLARQGRVLVASFHPEMTADLRVHREFLRLAGAHPVQAKERGRLVQAGP